MQTFPKPIGFILATLALSVGLVAGTAAADDANTRNNKDFDAQAEIRKLKAEIARLKADDEETWLNRRRAEEVKTLVREVLADAETRASLQGDGMVAGHDGNFFLASPDGRFYLELAGHLQVRYTYNNRTDSSGDDSQGGFHLRRAKFKPSGYVTAGDRRINFAASLAGDQDAGDSPIFEDYYVSTALADGLDIQAGRFKQPFSLQNIRSSSRQLAVERSLVNEVFNVDRSEGVMLSYSAEQYRIFGAINDGRDAQKTDFNQDSADFAATGRAELLLAGRWSQFKDASSWTGQGLGAMLGGAVNYQVGETGTTLIGPGPDGTIGTPDDVNVPNNNDFLLWTADLSVETSGLGVMLAGYGQHTDNESGQDFDDFGFFAEAGYMVVPDILEPFVRYEMIFADPDRGPVQAGSLDEETKLITAGINWYQAGHNAKFTLDAVYALDPLFVSGVGPSLDALGSSSYGFQPDAAGENGQFAVRAQYQLKW